MDKEQIEGAESAQESAAAEENNQNQNNQPEGNVAEEPNNTQQPEQKTQAQTGKAAEGKQEPKGYWPDDWRQRMSGGDEKLLNKLARYESPEAISKALDAAQQKISSGEYRRKISDNPTDEELAEYRKDLGIPESPKDYELKTPEGFSFGEVDQPFLDAYLQKMHEGNATPDQVNAGISAYVEMLEQQQTEYKEKDIRDQENFEDSLRSEWGNEFRMNKNIVENFISQAPDSVKEALQFARSEDGTAIMNMPEFARWVNNIARQANPTATLIPKGISNAQGVEDKIKEYEAMMAKDINAWHKNTKAKEDYIELLRTREKLQNKS